MGRNTHIATDPQALANLLAERTTALSGADRSILERFVREQTAILTQRGVDQMPVLIARLYDVAGCLRDLLKIEDAFELDPVATRYETLGKARDRFRKAMKEFEDAIARFGVPTGRGLADTVRPLLAQTAGVLESALISPGETSTDADHSFVPASSPPEDTSFQNG